MFVASAKQGQGKNEYSRHVAWHDLFDKIQIMSCLGTDFPLPAVYIYNYAANCNMIPYLLDETNGNFFIKRKDGVFTKNGNPLSDTIGLEKINKTTFEEYLRSGRFVTREGDAIIATNLVLDISSFTYSYAHDKAIVSTTYYHGKDEVKNPQQPWRKIYREVIFAGHKVLFRGRFFFAIEFAASTPNSFHGGFTYEGNPFLMIEGVTDQPHTFGNPKMEYLADSVTTSGKAQKAAEEEFIQICLKPENFKNFFPDELHSDENSNDSIKPQKPKNSDIIALAFLKGAELKVAKEDRDRFQQLRNYLRDQASQVKTGVSTNLDRTYSTDKLVYFTESGVRYFTGKPFDFVFDTDVPYVADSTMAAQWNPVKNPGPGGKDLSLLSLYPKRTFVPSVWLRPTDNAPIDIFAGLDVDSISSGILKIPTQMVEGREFLGGDSFFTIRWDKREVEHVFKFINDEIEIYCPIFGVKEYEFVKNEEGDFDPNEYTYQSRTKIRQKIEGKWVTRIADLLVSVTTDYSSRGGLTTKAGERYVQIIDSVTGTIEKTFDIGG